MTYDELPEDPVLPASQPALSDVAFDAKRKGIHEALGEGVFAT